MKRLNECISCLLRHTGPCKFNNRHICARQSDTDKHNALLCPETTGVSVAALTANIGFEAEPGLLEVLEVCQGLSLDPEELFDLMPGQFSDSGFSGDSGSDSEENDDASCAVNGGLTSVISTVYFL